MDPFALASADAAENSSLLPQTQCHGVAHGDRKVAVEFRLLGKIGDFPAVPDAERDAAVIGCEDSDDCLQQGALAGTIGTDDGGEAAGSEGAGKMVDGRHPVIGDGEVLKGDGSDGWFHW